MLTELKLGVSLAVGSSIISNLGVNFQKLTHVLLERRNKRSLCEQEKRESVFGTQVRLREKDAEADDKVVRPRIYQSFINTC